MAFDAATPNGNYIMFSFHVGMSLGVSTLQMMMDFIV